MRRTDQDITRCALAKDMGSPAGQAQDNMRQSLGKRRFLHPVRESHEISFTSEVVYSITLSAEMVLLKLNCVLIRYIKKHPFPLTPITGLSDKECYTLIIL
jgi:hypothetical protein